MANAVFGDGKGRIWTWFEAEVTVLVFRLLMLPDNMMYRNWMRHRRRSRSENVCRRY